MGRLFLRELEGPVYKCKYCPDVDIVVYDQIDRRLPSFEFPASLGKIRYYFRCFNVEIGTNEVRIPLNGPNNQTYVRSSFKEVFCVSCGSHLGFYQVYDKTRVCRVVECRYNEGNFFINRFKLRGPPEGSDDENPQVGGN